MSDKFICTNTQYGSGFEVNEYKGKVSLIAAREYNGKIYQKWGDIEIKKDEKKRLPVAIELGNGREEAIYNLKLAIAWLQKEQDVPDYDPTIRRSRE